MAAATPREQLAAFIAKYSPEVARERRAALKALDRLLPGAVRLVYDNYHFLVVGYGPRPRRPSRPHA